LTSNVATPQNTGTAITFTAWGDGGVAPRQFKFFVQQTGGSPQMVRDWSTTQSYTWTPATAAGYTVIVWVRSAGVTVDAAQAIAQMAYTINTPPPAPVTSVALTSNLATPQNTNTAITFSASGAGGVAPREFKFFVQLAGGAAQVAQNWSTATTYTWTPATVGNYTVTVWARSAGVTVDAAQASAQMAYVVNTPPIAPVASAGLTSNVATPQNTGTAITFTAWGDGGVAPRQFKFFVQQTGGSPQMVRDWSTATGYTWTPATAASYTVIVWVRSAGVTVDAAQASAQMAYTINIPPPAPVTSATLSSNVASPQVTGTAVTFTANGSGGVAPREFKFLVQPSGGAVQVVQNWSTATTYTWTPATAGTYTVTVWARSAGVTVDAAQASAQMSYVVSTPPIAPVTGATLTTSPASPQNAGTAIGLSASGSGGVGPRQFKFFVQPSGGSAQMVRDWSTATSYTWTPTTAGTYTLIVWARSAGVTVDAAQASAQISYVVSTAPSGPLTITSLTSNVASPRIVGTSIMFTAAATGGKAPYQFKWWVNDGSSWRVAQDWGTSATFNWVPTTAGDYVVAVWARNNGATGNASEALAQVAYKITSTAPVNPLSISSLTSNVASPQVAGSTITFNAVATGGQASYQFKWWVYDGASWKVAQNWSSSATLTWRPTAGDYMVAVWARNSGVTVEASQAMAQMFYTITNAPTPPPPAPLALSLTSNATSPSMLGTTVTFSATATGGTAPYQFKWWIFDGSAWRVGQEWSTSSTFNWRPTIAGDYLVAVWGRSNGVTKNASEALAQTAYTIVTTAPTPPLAITSFTSNLASPQAAGTTVTFSTTATGGKAPYEFKWWVFDGETWKVGHNWSSNATFNWRPNKSGRYIVAVWARNAGVKVDASQALAQTLYTVN
jgi:hypothetical protein